MGMLAKPEVASGGKLEQFSQRCLLRKQRVVNEELMRLEAQARFLLRPGNWRRQDRNTDSYAANAPGKMRDKERDRSPLDRERREQARVALRYHAHGIPFAISRSTGGHVVGAVDASQQYPGSGQIAAFLSRMIPA